MIHWGRPGEAHKVRALLEDLNSWEVKMSKEWLLPHEPELLYLRERVKRLEAELEYQRGCSDAAYSILRPPETLALHGVILPTSYRIHTLGPLVTANAYPGEGRYHIILRTEGGGSVGYGYYVTNHELYSARDLCGLMAYLHKRTVFSLAELIEKKAGGGPGPEGPDKRSKP